MGYLDQKAKKTIAIYGMLDTKPVNESGWRSASFEAEIINDHKYGDIIVARGAVGLKGPLITWLNSIESIIAVDGKLPVNIMFLAETEENIGSPN